MLAGKTPFASTGDDSPEAILARIESGKVELNTGVWTTISAAARAAVKRTLHVDPTRRPTAAQLLADPWLQGDGANFHAAQPQVMKYFII